tara:strand:- start:264 stop:476 length:213 start_codon:yes stop_codon:yes gene_type:complete
MAGGLPNIDTAGPQLLALICDLHWHVRRTLQDLAQMSVFLLGPVQDDHHDSIDLLPFCKQGLKIIKPFSP